MDLCPALQRGCQKQVQHLPHETSARRSHQTMSSQTLTADNRESQIEEYLWSIKAPLRQDAATFSLDYAYGSLVASQRHPVESKSWSSLRDRGCAWLLLWVSYTVPRIANKYQQRMIQGGLTIEEGLGREDSNAVWYVGDGYAGNPRGMILDLHMIVRCAAKLNLYCSPVRIGTGPGGPGNVILHRAGYARGDTIS